MSNACSSLARQVAIAIAGVGMAVHTTQDGYKPTPMELYVGAAREAIAEGGIDRSAIGALPMAPPTVQNVPQFCDGVLNEREIAPSTVVQVHAHAHPHGGPISSQAVLLAREPT